MSQVKFNTTYKGKPVEVMAGWDNPCQHYYLTVFDLDEDADEETIWSTIEHPSDNDTHTLELQKQVASMGFKLPEGFWERVHLQEGNVRHINHLNRWVQQKL